MNYVLHRSLRRTTRTAILAEQVVINMTRSELPRSPLLPCGLDFDAKALFRVPTQYTATNCISRDLFDGNINGRGNIVWTQ